jgi:zinc transporter, ZIP family
MVSLAETIALSAVMGFAIFLSLPIVLRRKTKEITTRFLEAGAIGILIFLMGDIFADVSTLLYNNSLYGYGTIVSRDLYFAASLCAGFLILFFLESRSKSGLSGLQLALIIALGMGFQNLTEGLVFGATGAEIGLTGTTLVVLIGFILQNITEGFPIASPFLGKTEGKIIAMIGLFAIGGFPTIFGGALGFYYKDTVLDIVFDGAAIGAILYAILPMLRMLFRESDLAIQRIGYIGIFVGFMVGFLVNLI